MACSPRFAGLAAGPVGDGLADVTMMRNEIYLLAMGGVGLASYGVGLLALGWKR